MYARTLQRPKQRISEVKKFASPTAGWISNRALAVPSGDNGNLPQGAMVLDNFFPRSTSVTLRRGKLRYCTLGDGSEQATAIFSYNNGPNKKLFGATPSTIYDITDVEFATDAEIVTENDDLIVTENGDWFGWSSTEFLSVMGGFTGGDWSIVQFATTGGVYLIGVNGADTGFVYDGAVFYPYVDGGVQALAYDAEVSEFTIGDTVTGAASGATGKIWHIDDQGGGEGVLYIYEVATDPWVWNIGYENGSEQFHVGAELESVTGRATITADAPGTTTWTLAYDGGTGLFAPAETVTGGTSGATATVVSVDGVAASGTLTVSGLAGTFQDNEALTGSVAGAATAAGTQSAPIYAGVLTVEVASGVFNVGEEITDDEGGEAEISSSTYVSGGPFQNNEALSDTGGGAATAASAADPYIPGITFPDGLTTADMSFVWVYRNRLYFAETGSMNAWYLPVDSIGGTAAKFPLSGVFGLGGSLLFGQRWSLSSGGDGGLSEQNTFISTEGEVAIYQGLGPDDPQTWSQQGLYRIGRPLGKRAFIRGAGDLAIATSVGLVPLSKAIELDLTALTVASISYPIADAWQDALDQRGVTNWQGQIWPDQKVAVFAPPATSNSVMFIANTETGAWSRFTGWEGLCFDVFGGRLFFGESTGAVYIANETGLDDGIPYSGACLPLYDDLGSPASRKIAKVGRYILRASAEIVGRVTWQSDYNEQLPPAPDAESLGSAPSIWGDGIWGQSVWTEGLPRLVVDRWHSLGGTGYNVSLAFQVTSGSLQPLDAEVISSEVLYETADAVS